LEDVVSVDIVSGSLRVLGVKEDFIAFEHTVQLLYESQLISGWHSQSIVVTRYWEISPISLEILLLIDQFLRLLFLFKLRLLFFLLRFSRLPLLGLCHFLSLFYVNTYLPTLFEVFSSQDLSLLWVGDIAIGGIAAIVGS
jgi:hypothetical protein